MKKRILVTGGAGFIGSHTCLSLIENNYEIVVLDSFVNSNPLVIKRIENISKYKNDNKNKLFLVEGDLRDKEVVNNIFEKAKSDGNPIFGVIHFAGLKAVGESLENPLCYWDSNLISSINLLKSMNKYDCKVIVFSSSATVYGISQNNLINENSALNPSNPYGNTKFAIEKLLFDLFQSSSKSWRIANLRYFNPIGAHQSGLIGEETIGIPNNIFPYILKVAKSEIPKLTIFGKDWPTPDGTGIRDYIHVMDLAEGHIAALDYLSRNKPQFININLGTGKDTSVLELVQVFKETNKINIPFVFSQRRKGDLARVVADNSLALKLLDWSPKRDIKEMCADGWKWINLNPNGYR